MAKKNWLDVAKEVATDAAISAFIPGGIIGKAAYVAGKEIYNNLSEGDEPCILDLALSAYDNDDYENALKYLQQAKGEDEINIFHYYRLCGMCHYFIMANYQEDYEKQAKQLGLSDESPDDDPRWERISPLKDRIQEEKSEAYDLLKECLKHKNEDDFVADNDSLSSVYWALTFLCDTIYERRRYDMAAMAADKYRKDAKEEYKATTNTMLEIVNDAANTIERMDEGDWSDWNEMDENSSIEEKKACYDYMKGLLFSGKADYHERQFIYIAKNVDALAGCYDDNIQWLFTIDSLPKELQFPVGHPQPNSLYYAHPAKRGVYLPIEDADDELFNDKVRDFQRLAQCLGATEITFRSVKGHSLSESISKGYDVEVGGGYEGYEGNVGYGNKQSSNNSQSLQGQREMVMRFNPNKAPYIPDDVAWLSVDPEWQSLVKQRLDGNMLHYSVRISSRKTMAVTDSRMDDVKVAFKSFVASAHVNYSQQMERSFQREEETEWEISVTFKPLEEFDHVESSESPSFDTISVEEYHQNRIATEIQHYILNVVYDDDSNKPDLNRIAEKIKNDTGISIPTNRYDRKTKQEVKDVLTSIVAHEIGENVNWHNLITTLPRKDYKNKFRMDVYDWEDVVDIGGVILGVVTSGSVSVGDKVRIFTDIENKQFTDATVSWIEMFGMKLPEAQAGDSLGLGVDIDINSIMFNSTESVIGLIVKPDECSEDAINELSDAEQDYLENLRELFEDDGEITPRERKMLERIRQSLGISEERAQELEASLAKPQLTEDEQEYLDMYHEYSEKGEVTEKERRRLDKFAAAMGITAERVKEIEKV